MDRSKIACFLKKIHDIEAVKLFLIVLRETQKQRHCKLISLFHSPFLPFLGHSERALLYYELEDGLYTAEPYFFAKVTGQA